MSTVELEYHLSRIFADRRDVPDAYEGHRKFWRAYGLTEETRGAPQPFRFRQEVSHSDRQRVCYLVQSAAAPDWSKVDYIEAQTKWLKLQIAAGSAFNFQVSSPVYTSSRDGDRRFKTPLRSEEEVLAWFEKRAQAAGFVPTQYSFSRGDDQTFKVGSANKDRHHQFSLNVVQFNGKLEVVGTQEFVETVKNGFGPKPAMGLGLFTITPAG